jgi:uncharacterized protein YceH (UPF0502 family)
MADDTAAPAHEPLTLEQRRVLGVLIEKQKTSRSADAYPMTLNSIVVGCNQKSNRDPVLELDDDTVEETLGELQKAGFVVKVTGGRADRYRHLLYDVWRVGKVEMAILAELLMRGPQSEGDLRGRASRMDDIADLDTLRELLKGLVARNFVVYLTPPGRGAMLTHGFHLPGEIEAAKSAPQAFSTPPAAPASTTKWDDVMAELAALKERVAKLEARFPE